MNELTVERMIEIEKMVENMSDRALRIGRLGFDGTIVLPSCQSSYGR